ncbi:MAG: NAD-dependent epimerase/dehydratase family protein [Candidatus Eremiobacterota bacterium]
MQAYRGLDVLVTGAGGFLGSHTCRALLQAGARVHGLVRPGREYPRLGPLARDVELHRVDVADSGGVQSAVRRVRPRVVFHLAASLDRARSLRTIETLTEVNIQGTLNVLRAAASAGTEVVVYTGSYEEYGRLAPPFSEAQAIDPLTPYAASKATASLWCRTLHKSIGLNAIAARLFMIYGPGQPEFNFIPQLLEAVRTGTPLKMTRGEQTRDFTWVDDAVEALLRLGRQPALGGQVFNVCTGRETSLHDVIILLESVLGREVPVELGALEYRESELFRVWGSPSTLLGATGYKPRTELREGLELLVRAEGILD